MLIDHDDRDWYTFYLDGRKVDRVIKADPERGWIEYYTGLSDLNRRRGCVEAVHKRTYVVRRTERK